MNKIAVEDPASETFNFCLNFIKIHIIYKTEKIYWKTLLINVADPSSKNQQSIKKYGFSANSRYNYKFKKTETYLKENNKIY